MIVPRFTVGVLILLLSQHYGVTVEQFEIQDETGAMVTVRILVRECQGYWHAYLGKLRNEDMVSTDVIRSICSQLGVPPLDFGIPLKWDET